MTTYGLLICVPMFGLLVWAAAEDLRARRIPNWLTLGLVLTGLLQSFVLMHVGGRVHTVTPVQSLLGLLVGFGLPFVLFALNALGGGDVKLMAGVGAWLGPAGAAQVFVVTAVVGMVIVLAQAYRQGRTRTLFRNSAVVAINLVHVSQLGAEHVAETGLGCRSVDKPLPYAVPVLVAAAAVVIGGWV